MALLKDRIGFFLAVIVIGGLVGSIVGEIFGLLLPTGVIHNIFVKGLNMQLGPATLNLVVFSITLGFGLKLNFCGLLGIALALLIYKKT